MRIVYLIDGKRKRSKKLERRLPGTNKCLIDRIDPRSHKDKSRVMRELAHLTQGSPATSGSHCSSQQSAPLGLSIVYLL